MFHTYIVPQLLAGLNRATSAIDMVKPTWVLSLSEAHCVLYIVYNGTSRQLLWQDAGGSEVRWIGLMTLADDECIQWTNKIETALTDP